VHWQTISVQLCDFLTTFCSFRYGAAMFTDKAVITVSNDTPNQSLATRRYYT